MRWREPAWIRSNKCYMRCPVTLLAIVVPTYSRLVSQLYSCSCMAVLIIKNQQKDLLFLLLPIHHSFFATHSKISTHAYVLRST